MPYDPIERMTRARPPRPPARVAENLELATRPQDEAFSRLLWRQTLAREIRKARAEAGRGGRDDPALLRERLRGLYREHWGGGRPAAKAVSEDPGPEHPCGQRKAHD